jgi:hypothetical protein
VLGSRRAKGGSAGGPYTETYQAICSFHDSSERRFIEPLEAASAAPLEYMTMFCKGPSRLETGSRLQPVHTVSQDGVVSTAASFMTFQLESEYENVGVQNT